MASNKWLNEDGLTYLWQIIKSKLAEKQDKKEGWGLSENNYSTSDRDKLQAIEEGAQKNQNAFGKVAIGTTGTLTAAAESDTLTLKAGANIKLTPDTATKTVTINATVDTFELEEATKDEYGGIKIGYEEVDKKYAVKLDDDGHAYVSVPWEGIEETGVDAGTYRSVTVNSKGQVTAGTNPTTLAGYGITDTFWGGPDEEIEGAEKLVIGDDKKTVLTTDVKITNDMILGPISVENGGTGATNADEALKNLGFSHDAEEIDRAVGDIGELQSDLENKVDKVNGKQLSTNDFNNTYKETLDTLSETYAKKADLVNVYKYKGSVETYEELTQTQNPTVGDVYNVTSTDMNYAWDGSQWDPLGSSAIEIEEITVEDINRICV